MGNTLDGYTLTARQNNTLASSRYCYDTIIVAYNPRDVSEAQQQLIKTYPQIVIAGKLNHGTTRDELAEWMRASFPMSREIIGMPGYMAALFQNELNGTQLSPAIQEFILRHS